MENAILTALSLAGFLFSQVTSVASELRPSSVTPVAFVIKGEDQRFTFFEGLSLQAMVENGRRTLSDRQYDGWAFAYEGYLTTAGIRKSALFVEAWRPGLSEPVMVVQVWERSPRGEVKLVGVPLMFPRRDSPDAARVKKIEPAALSQPQQQAFDSGIERHRAVKGAGLIGNAVSPPHQ